MELSDHRCTPTAGWLGALAATGGAAPGACIRVSIGAAHGTRERGRDCRSDRWPRPVGRGVDRCGRPQPDRRVARAPASARAAPTFEWYVCRGAFFHTDAHYANVLFGVWYIDGPPVDLVFPRIRRRVARAPGFIDVFDPFEVHGVLHPGVSEYRAADYLDCGAERVRRIRARTRRCGGVPLRRRGTSGRCTARLQCHTRRRSDRCVRVRREAPRAAVRRSRRDVVDARAVADEQAHAAFAVE